MNEDDDADDDDKGMSANRYPCMPSLVALQQMKNRLHLAHLGKKLMKWTAQATVRELRRIGQDIVIQYEGFKEEIRQAFIILARSRFYQPMLNRIVLENIPKTACLHITTTTRSVSGVKLYVLEIVESPEDPYSFLGIEKGGNTITETKRCWRDLLKKMIFMTELRKSFTDVDLANKTATKRCNVIKRILIPKLKKTIAYILAELEEREREETFRIKQFKKLKDRKKKKDEVRDDKAHICSCCLTILQNDKEMSDKLCDICKKQDIGKKQKIPDRICDPCNLEDGKLDIRLRLETLTNHIDEVIGLTKVYTREGLVSPSMEKFIKTCHAVKERIEDAGGILPICDVCKQEMQKSEKTEIPHPETPKSGKSVVSVSSKKTVEEPAESIYNLGSESSQKFGYFEKKFKEIVKVTRLQNDDGTVSEEKQVITIRTERRNPKRPGSGSCGGRNDNPYLGPGGHDGDSKKNFRFPRNTKSEHTGHSDNMGEPTLRPCMSAGFQNSNKDESTNYDASTCCSAKSSQSSLGKSGSHTCGPRTASSGTKPSVSQVSSKTSISMTRSCIPKSTSSAQTCCKEIPVAKPDQTCSCKEIPAQAVETCCKEVPAQAPVETCCKVVPVPEPVKTCSCKEKPAPEPVKTCSCKDISTPEPVKTCSCKDVLAQAPVETCCKVVPAPEPVKTCSCKEKPAPEPVKTCSCKDISTPEPAKTCSCKEVPAQAPVETCCKDLPAPEPVLTCCKEVLAQAPVQPCQPCSCHGDAVEPNKSEDKKSVGFRTTGLDAVWRDACSSTTELNVKPSRLPNANNEIASCSCTEIKKPTQQLEKPIVKCKVKIVPKSIEADADEKCCPPPSPKRNTCGPPPSIKKNACGPPPSTKKNTCGPPPPTKQKQPKKEKEICLQGSLVDILKTIILPKPKECPKCSTSKVGFTDPEKPSLICKSCISKLSSFVAKHDLDNESVASDTSSCKVCQAGEELNEQEMSCCASRSSKPDSSPSLSCKSLAVGGSSEEECCQPKPKQSLCCEKPPTKPKKPQPCCKNNDEDENSSSSDEKCIQASGKPSPCDGKAPDKHKKPHICCIDKEKDEDSKGVSCCSLAAKLSAKSSKSAKSAKSSCCSSTKPSAPKTCPTQQTYNTDCCESKDVSTSTKRTDKFDVRSLKNLKSPKKCTNNNKKVCTCVSEPVLGGNTNKDPNSIFKKSKSCEHEHYELFFRW